MSSTAELASRNGGQKKDPKLYRSAVKATMRKRECGADGQWRRVDPTEAEVDLFLMKAATYGLDPLGGQIYASWDRGVMEVVTTIDGLRLLAERTGKYNGQAPAEWCDEEGIWKDVWLGEGYPTAARVGVFKEGRSEPTAGTVHWTEFAPSGSEGGDSMWKMGEGMPAHMLGIRAEALALRKAFPAELGGLYTAEELGVGEPADTASAAPSPDSPPAEAAGAGAFGPSVIVDPPAEQPSGAPARPQSRRTLAEVLESGDYAKLRNDLVEALFDQLPDRLTDEQTQQLSAALAEADEAGITAVELERNSKVGLREPNVAVRSKALLEWIEERRRKASAEEPSAAQEVTESSGAPSAQAAVAERSSETGGGEGPATMVDSDPGPESSS